MIFLSLRNNRKLSKSIFENIRKLFFGFLIALVALLLVMSLDIDLDQFKQDFTAFDIHYLSALILTIISMPLTMFILLAMNKNEYGKKVFRYLFEVIYLSSCVGLGVVFYLHIISAIWVQLGFLIVSVSITFLSFVLSRTHINYKATTMFGPLVVKPLSFDKKLTGVFGFIYLVLAFCFQGGNIIFFKYIDTDMDNYLAYQFLIQFFSALFYILCISILSKSRSIGQSQEVLYYRYVQLFLMSLTFLVIGLGIYRIFIPVQSVRSNVDNISMALNIIPVLVLFIDLWVSNRKVKNNKLYQGLTELRLMIKIFAAVIFVLINMVAGVEAKFFMTGETQENIDVTLVGLGTILIILIFPFFIFWKKITKRSSRILMTFILVLFSFVIYKFFFYTDITNLDAQVLRIPVDSLYTMITLIGLIGVQIATIVYQARNSAVAYKRYSALNTRKTKEKEVSNG